MVQGRSNGGGYRYLYPAKSAQVNFLWGKMTPERLFNRFIYPQKLLCPPKQISGYAPGMVRGKTRKPSWRKGYARQRRHSKTAAVPRWPSPAILDIIEPQIEPIDPPTQKTLV